MLNVLEASMTLTLYVANQLTDFYMKETRILKKLINVILVLPVLT